MRLLEYQAKELFKEFGIRVPDSIASTNIEKGRNLFKEVTKVYQENLVYYSGLDEEDIMRFFEDKILLDIQRYRSLVDLLFVYNDKEFAMEEMKTYNNYVGLLEEFFGTEEELEEPIDDIDIQSILNDTIKDSIVPEE